MSPKDRIFYTAPDGTTAPSGEAEPNDPHLTERTMEAMSFSTHVVSLNAMALMHLGHFKSGDAEFAPDISAARHVIDTLAMLKTKTSGNLTEAEERLLDSVLYDLRLKFVQHK